MCGNEQKPDLEPEPGRKRAPEREPLISVREGILLGGRGMPCDVT